MWQVVLLVVIAGCGGPRSSGCRIASSEIQVTSDTLARQIVDELARGRQADARVTSGRFLGMTVSESVQRDGGVVVQVACRFEATTLEAHVSFDARRRVSGLRFLPRE